MKKGSKAGGIEPRTFQALATPNSGPQRALVGSRALRARAVGLKIWWCKTKGTATNFPILNVTLSSPKKYFLALCLGGKGCWVFFARPQALLH